MTCDKNQKLRITRPWQKSLGVFFTLMASILSLNLIFTNKTYALFAPSLLASIDKTALVVQEGNNPATSSSLQEVSANLTINTNDKSGYRILVSTDSADTALTHSNASVTDKINSIPGLMSLSSFTNRTWGYKLEDEAAFRPIAPLSSPTNLFTSEEMTERNEVKKIIVGVNLGNNLVSGQYKNTLMISVITNNTAGTNATLTKGPDFNQKISRAATLAGTNFQSIKGFTRSSVAPSAAMKTVNIEDANESSYEIKAWYDSADQTVYYYCENDRVYMNEDSRQMFNNMINIVDIDLSGLNSRYVKDTSFMFNNARSVENLDLSGFKTSRVTSMVNMFAYMSSLKNLNISNFKTKKVKNFSRMFINNTALTSLNISNFDTSSAVSMDNMFNGLSRVSSLDVSHFDTSNVTNMQNMFFNCSGLTSLNVSSFDTSKVTNMESMFGGVTKLESLDIRNFDTSSVTSMLSMFGNMRELKDFKISDKFKTHNVTNFASMFSNCVSLASLDLSNFDTSKAFTTSAMFSGMSKVKRIDLGPKFNTSNVVNMMSMFNGCSLLEALDLSTFDTRKVTEFANMFNACATLQKLDVSMFDTSSAVSMSGMFSNMLALSDFNLGHNFNTSNVISMQNMFFNDRKLTRLDLSQFNTSKVTQMANMFGYMFGLEELNLSSFDTSSVTSMASMFQYTGKIQNLDLSNFNTSRVNSMSMMFYSANSLTNLTFGPHFDTSNVTDMEMMFFNVNSATELDLSTFNTSNVKKLSGIFGSTVESNNLQRIYVSRDFDLSKVPNNGFARIFARRKNLRGGAGSFLPNPDTADKTWLRIDRAGAPGYFTQKP